MPSLINALQDESKHAVIAQACCRIIDQEVADKRGLSGLAIKAAYKTVKNIKPGFVDKVVHHLLPEFAQALHPIHQEALAQQKPVLSYFSAHSGRAADALLSITDEKATASTNAIVKSAYTKLRGSAKKHVEAAMPRLASLIETHAS